MNSQPISVISEYRELGLDFEQLLTDFEMLKELLNKAESDKDEKQKELAVTQLCYDRNPNVEYRKFLDETNIEFCKSKYKVAMLKIANLLSMQFNSLEQCKDKRRKLLDLIKYRKSYLLSLGVRLVIDPFDRVKLNEQFELISSFDDNSKIISGLRKQISELNARTEEMLRENNNYLVSLNNTKSLIEDRVRFDDIDVSSVEFDFEDMLSKKQIEPNQVISIRTITDRFNMNIVRQKTASVIKRVSKMLSGSSRTKREDSKDLVPELVIIPKKIEKVKEEVVPEDVIDISLMEVPTSYENDMIDEVEEEVSQNVDTVDTTKDVSHTDNVIKLDSTPVIEPIETLFMDTDSIFETKLPFEEPTLFIDRADESNVTPINEDSLTDEETQEEFAEMVDAEILSESEETMPDAFWVVQDDLPQQVHVEEHTPSFEDQINMLLASENDDKRDSKMRKKVA